MNFFRKHRRLPLCAAVLAAAMAAAVESFASAAVTAGSWGLSFRAEGEAPVGNAGRALLGGYDAAYLGDGEEKVLYLTFDAGYENGYTPQLLDVLRAHHVPAAFFLVGNYLEREPELVQRMVDEGHTVGNHTWSHPDMSKITNRESFTAELKRVEDKFREITGQELEKYYRPPQGIYSEENLALAQELGYRTVFWSLAYVDWNNDAQPDPQQALDKLLPRTHNGAVVLLHATSATNAAILDELLTRWEKEGYRFAPLSELFAPQA